jgi:hypothetical protein
LGIFRVSRETRATLRLIADWKWQISKRGIFPQSRQGAKAWDLTANDAKHAKKG